jgi:MoxR-like ATPase
MDEIDRADEEFEGYLLELLAEFQVTIRARHHPA